MGITLGWGARQILGFLLLAIFLAASSTFLELTTVVRLASDNIQTETGLIAQMLSRQIDQHAREHPDDPLKHLPEDQRLQLVLQAATDQAPATVFVAILDLGGRAILHTNPAMVGNYIEPHPPLPKVSRLREAISVLLRLDHSPQVYQVDTPLVMGGVPFVTIRVGIHAVLLQERVAQAFRRGLFTALLQLSLAVGIGFALARVAAGRLREIEAVVAAMREGKYEARIPESGVDEFSRLAHDLNLLSEQIQREREARTSGPETVQRAISLVGEAMIALGPERRVVLMSAPAGQILGLDPSSCQGKTLEQIVPLQHPLRRLGEALYREPNRSLSVPLPTLGSDAGRGNGDESEEESGYVAVGHRIEGQGGPAGALIEIKSSDEQEELHSLVDQSRVLARVGQMAAGVAHEIRNPLQAINFELANLRNARELSAEEVESHVRAALDEMQRLQRAVKGFLKVVRLRKLAVEPVRPNDLVEDVGAALETEASMSGLELQLDLDPEIPDVGADRDILRQAVENLIKNAIQAEPSREGRIVLRTRREGDQVWISVRDTGPGMSPKVQERAFDLYFTTKRGGTGVGLALVRQAVEIHGGEVALESEPGAGTVVTLKLPLPAAREYARQGS